MKSIVRVLAVIATAGMENGQETKPNILFIMGDDIGFMQPGDRTATDHLVRFHRRNTSESKSR